MKKMYKKKMMLLSLLFLAIMAVQAQISPQFIGRFSTGIYDKAAAEITAYDAVSKRMFVLNGPDTSIKVVDISKPANPVQISTISIKSYGKDQTSIACMNGVLAVTVINTLGKTENGVVVFFNASTLAYINKVDVGANPDMVIFSPNGKLVLVANEGEPNDDYTIDREGSISIIDISKGISALTQNDVKTAGFTDFNGTNIDWKIKITGKIQSGGSFLRNSTIAEDLEPEYISVSEDSKTAWATCQENNCIAVIDLTTSKVTKLIPLGFKNHSLTGNGIDATDVGSAINIKSFPVFGMYMPDAIASYTLKDTTYLFTANEGDSRADWGTANNEEIRFGNAAYIVDTAKFGGAANVAALKATSAMGRLNLTKAFGDFNKDGKYDSAFCYGARSFSVWNSVTGKLAWDSKDEFEQKLAAIFPSNFNASHTSNTIDSRSDDKGPEPEAVTIGKILDSTYAFVGLERIGGIMIYNITNPNKPYFVNYINTRNLSVTPSLSNLATVGDLGPEGLVFIPKSQSPNGQDLLLVSNEVSGTVAIIQLNGKSAFQMQILHSSDMESGVPAVVDAPYYAATVDKLEDQHNNTLILSSGDNTLPGPFLSAGEDPSMQTALRSTASSYYKGSQAQRPALGRPDIAIMNIIGFNASTLGNHEFDLGTGDLNGQIGVDIRSNGADKRWLGAQFPYVSSNLDFSKDANLNYLFTNQILRDTAFRTPVNITANSQKKGLAPSIIIERNGEKIGVVGVTTQALAKISSPGLTSVKGPQVDDMPALAAILQPVIDSLIAKEGVNKIILLAHLQQITNEKALAPLLNHVDIIISGGNHNFTADGNDRLIAGHTATERYPIITKSKSNDPMVILNTTSEWKYVGRFVCDFDKNGKLLIDKLDSNVNGVYASDSVTVKALWGTNNAFATGTKGANVLTLCKAVGLVIAAKDGNILGKSNVFLEGRRNAVRTEETNLGNISSDANLWYAKKYDPKVSISLKNGGGIRSAVGYVNSVGSNVILERNQANPLAGKSAGDVSQLDVENSLRFNNSLVIVSVSAAGVKRLIEHSVSGSKPGLTPGQFPQVGGVSFSYDTSKTSGNKIWSMVLIDSVGNSKDTLVKYGKLVGDTSRTYKIVTLNFLANPSFVGSSVGGDNYPFPTVVRARVDLDTAIKTAGTSSFSLIGREQDAFAEYMLSKHNTSLKAYKVRDTSVMGDTRIQLINARPDAIFPKLSSFSLLTPANNSRVAVKDADPTPVTITWEKSTGATRYVWILDLQSGNFKTPLLTLQSNNNGKNNDLTLTSGGISSALAGLGVVLGDSINLKWTVKAYQEGHDSLTASLPFNIKFVRLIKTPTNVDALGLENNINIYPNPVIDFMNLTNTTGKNLDIQVIDLKGQILYEGNVSEMAKIDLNHLAAGLYILRVQTVNQDPLRYLFIKSN
jgi:2',3'-cyclic-nucleotide 2'-phosphodiesterase (5'-nucleotidase family)